MDRYVRPTTQFSTAAFEPRVSRSARRIGELSKLSETNCQERAVSTVLTDSEVEQALSSCSATLRLSSGERTRDTQACDKAIAR